MTTIDTITTAQISALRDEAGAHGDLDMVAICDRAIADDTKAIAECVRVIESAEAPEGAVAYKYADALQDACWLYSEDDVRDVEREDPSLIVRVSQPGDPAWDTDGNCRHAWSHSWSTAAQTERAYCVLCGQDGDA